jgi:uncharacterized protein
VAGVTTEFLGRSAELRLLDAQYELRGSSAFVPIYGRRRVGKSELILQFLARRKGLYFLGKQAPGPLQLREFLGEAARALDEPLLANASFDSWRAALLAVTERIRGPNKWILALDEFQWIAAAAPELPSVLQELWDRHWSRSGKLMLIVCGSYMGFMEREVLGRESPLFGRRTAQIQLRPFGYSEAAQFHRRYSVADRARAYFICGGVPWYLKRFDQRRSIETNIVTEILDEFGPLRREPDFLLREELREVDKYSAILTAISSGSEPARIIATQTGINERGLHYYLEQLVALGYVRRRYPLTGKAPTARSVRFSLDDPLLRFWFRFVFPNMTYIAQMGPERAFADRIRPELEAFFGHAFEDLCREAMADLYQRERVGSAFQIGEYWDKSTQIDVVGVRADGFTDVGECKWGSHTSRPQLEAELAAKAAAYPNDRGATIQLRAFTRKPVRHASETAEARSVRWHDLDELYATERPGPSRNASRPRASRRSRRGPA